MATSEENMEAVRSILENYDLPVNAIVGILANIAIETGGTFDWQQSSDIAHGLFQFDKPKKGKYKDYIKYLEEEKLQDSAESQIIYMMETIKTGREIGKGNAKKLRKIFETGSIEDITIAFSEIWERPSIPHNDRRVKWAKENAKHIIEVTDESEVGAAAMLEEEAEPIKEAEKAIYEPKGLAGAAAVSEVPELAKETKAGVDTVLLEEAAEPEEDLDIRDPFSKPIISGAAAVPLEGEQVREKIKYLVEVIQEYIPQGLGGAAAIDELDALRNPFQALEWLQDKIDNAVEELDIDKDDLYKTIRDIDIEEELRKLNVEGLETLEPEELERLEVDDEIKEILFQPDEDEVEEVLFHPDDKFFNDEEGIYDDQDFMHPSYFTEEEKDKYLDITRTDDDGMYHDVKWWKEKEEKEQAGKIDIRNDVEKEIKMYLDMLDEGIYGGEGHRVPYRAEERIRKTKDKKGHKVPYTAEDAI